MKAFRLSDQERKEIWARECSKPEHYSRGERAITYTGPTPRMCGCGEYHAPREACEIFGFTFAPRGNPA